MMQRLYFAAVIVCFVGVVWAYGALQAYLARSPARWMSPESVVQALDPFPSAR